MTNYLLFALSALLLFLNANCKKDIITPEYINPGSRNYSWTVDTVYAPYNLFARITGTSPNDLWTANTGDADKTFFHFDGNKWSTDLIPRPISPASIFSLSPTSVWSGGMRGEIWHFDGINWTRKYKHTIPDFNEGTANIIFEDIYAQSETDIYFVGQYSKDTTQCGLIVHFNGTDWQQINIPKIKTEFAKIRKDENGKMYIWGITSEQSTTSTYQFYEFDGITLHQIYSGMVTNEQLGDLLPLSKKIYFTIGYDFYSYKEGQFQKRGHLSDLPQYLNSGIGRSENDIFIGLLDGIAHYNGENTEYLIRFGQRIALTGMQIFEKNIFVIGFDQSGNNLIYHGMLNE